MIRWPTCLAAFLACAAPAAAQVQPSPYAHQGSTQVKTLSQSEVDDLLSGAGIGLARPAELNGYPGPLHVLELADSLALTSEQRDAVQEIFDAMKERARGLGQRIVGAERALDAAFASGDASEEALLERVRAAAEPIAELRWVHLRAHLETRRVLGRHQVSEYDRLRGYGSGHAH